ncbi:MAG: TIGR00725 family protein [bacterium]|nr:TIGR00725 family protein [bacterium]
MSRPLQIAVAGGGTCGPRAARQAETLGRALAEGGAVVICGGLGGAMAAVSRGARAAGGLVVGLLPGYAHADGNPWLGVALPTGIGHARNVLVAAAGDVLVALPGAHGTLSEIALARVLGRPVVVLGGRVPVAGVVRARSPEDAARRALRLAATGGAARASRTRRA